jgi:multidrug efflux pump subunit AcrA (membrane-fusion protein)
LLGDAGADELNGEDGDDTLQGGDADDRLAGGEGADQIEGGEGADTLLGGAGADILIGGAGDDVYEVSMADGDQVVDAEGANVIRILDATADTLEGGLGDDALAGGAGVAKALATHTLGTVVGPGTVLMTLVRKDERLQTEVFVGNEDSGFMHEGQRVRVKLAAYPFPKYGMLEGTVAHLGADASDARGPSDKQSPSRATGQQGGFGYRALVALDSQMLGREGTKLKLAAGMQVVAEIHPGERSVIEYLLSPVQKTVSKAGRER